MRYHLEFDDFGEFEELFDETEGELFWAEALTTVKETESRSSAA